MSYVVRLGELENDGVSYAMWLESQHGQPARTVQSAERFRTWPVATGVQQGAVTDALHVVIRPEQPKDEVLDGPLRSALLQTLDTDVAAVALVIADNDGGRERYRYYVTRGLDEQEDEVAGLHWVATLVTADDTKWRSVAVTTVVWEVAESGAQRVVANGGDAPALPTYELRPTADRTAGWDHRRFAAVFPNTQVVTTEEMPYDIADGGWNTAALVTAGTITSADEIGVIVDGREVRRWITGFNTTQTNVWINLSFRQAAEFSTLTGAGIGPGDVVAELEMAPQGNSIYRFPTRGMVAIDQEIFSYTGKDTQRRRFVGVTRGARDTAAGNHLSYAPVRLIEHEIWIVYGGRTAEEHFYDDAPGGAGLLYDDRKPTIDLFNSSNAEWVFTNWPGSPSAYRHPSITPFTSLLGGAGHKDAMGGGEWDAIFVSRSSGVTVGTGVDERILSQAEWRSYWIISLPGWAFTGLAATVMARRDDGGDWRVYFGTGLGMHSSTLLAEVGRPAALNTPEERTPDVTVGMSYPTALFFVQDGTAEMEAVLDYLVVRFDVDERPTIFLTGAHDNYSMDLRLANLTTGLAVGVRAEIAAGTEVGLAIDAERKRVTLIGDGTNRYAALTKDTQRADVLSLAAGDNTLQVDEEGLEGMQVVITFQERSYS